MVGVTVVVSQALADPSPDAHAHGAVWEAPRATPPLPDAEPEAEAAPDPEPDPTAPAAPAGQLNPDAQVDVPVEGFLTWAALDRHSQQLLVGGAETNTTESMIKPWIVADYLRRAYENGEPPDPEKVTLARDAIRDSDDMATERLYRASGADEVTQRLIDMCGLTDTTIFPGWWSRTTMTAVDAVRMGECLIDGTAAGPQWTPWLIDTMRDVQGGVHDQPPAGGVGGGYWGIVDGLPPGSDADQVAIKNGWTRIGETNSWHLNCLAMTDDWVIAVLMRYPAEYSLSYGADRCASVASQLLDTVPPSSRP